MLNLLIIGAGGHSRPVIEIALLLNIPISGIIDINYSNGNEEILGIPIIGGLNKINDFNPKDTMAFVAIGDNIDRKKKTEELITKGFQIPCLLHPSSIISDSAKIGDGSLISAGVILNSLVEIGKGCIINTGSILDHETQIGSFTHIAPGVKIAGRVEIGENCFVGIGTSIIDRIFISENVIIGAGSIIIKNISANKKVVGISKFIE